MPLALEQFGKNSGKPPVRLFLKNEIGIADSQIPDGNAGFYQLGQDYSKLHPNMNLMISKTSNRDYNARKRSLHMFLNEKMTGLFFVHPEDIQPVEANKEIQYLTKQYVGFLPITVLDPLDLEKFREFVEGDSTVVTDCTFNHAAADKNREILAKWQDKGVKLHNHALYNYAKPKVT